jgi:hypothetical protein
MTREELTRAIAAIIRQDDTAINKARMILEYLEGLGINLPPRAQDPKAANDEPPKLY